MYDTGVKIKTTEKLAKAISLPKPATDLVNEKPAILSTKVVTCASNLANHWIYYWLGWSLL